jgi:hypothetical protein
MPPPVAGWRQKPCAEIIFPLYCQDFRKSGTDPESIRNYLREERYEAAEMPGGMNASLGVAKRSSKLGLAP